MFEFKYRAVDKLNHPVEGTVRAENAADVVKQLSGQGLQVSSVEAVQPIPPRSARTRLSLDDLSLFNEQLSAIVKSGLPLAPSLEVLSKDVRGARLRRVVDALRADIEAGRSLTEAVERQPRAFSPVYASMVRAGEASGNLSASLEVLSTHAERNIELRYRLQESVAYPLLVAAIALLVMTNFSVRGVSVLVTGNQFGQSNVNVFTRFIIGLSSVVHDHWMGMIAGALGLVVLVAIVVRGLRSSKAGRRLFSAVGLRIPMYGPLLRDAATARFSRALGMLLTARVPVADSIRLAAGASGNGFLEEKCLRAAEDVDAGRSMSTVLEETRFFPETYSWLLRMGESRGDVDQVVLKLAETHEHAATRRGRFIAATASPAFTVIAAVMVVMAMLAVYRPLIAAMF